jgi:hypothetical protein
MKKLPTINHNRVPMGMKPKAQWAKITDNFHQAMVAGVIHLEISRHITQKDWDLKVYDPEGGEATERTSIKELKTAKIVAEVIAATIANKLAKKLLIFYCRRSGKDYF